VRVIVDAVLCEGNGVCTQVAPDVFELGDDDQARVLVEHPTEEQRARIETAVRRCPRQAIRLRED
jgi:ferredoxin